MHHETLAAQQRQILEALAADPETAWIEEDLPQLRIAVRGWPACMAAVCLEWLKEPGLSREQVRDLCARALLGAITP